MEKFYFRTHVKDELIALVNAYIQSETGRDAIVSELLMQTVKKKDAEKEEELRALRIKCNEDVSKMATAFIASQDRALDLCMKYGELMAAVKDELEGHFGVDERETIVRLREVYADTKATFRTRVEMPETDVEDPNITCVRAIKATNGSMLFLLTDARKSDTYNIEFQKPEPIEPTPFDLRCVSLWRDGVVYTRIGISAVALSALSQMVEGLDGTDMNGLLPCRECGKLDYGMLGRGTRITCYGCGSESEWPEKVTTEEQYVVAVAGTKAAWNGRVKFEDQMAASKEAGL